MVYLKLLLTFMKIGFVGFGGGLAILPLIYQGVTTFSPISPEDFANLVGISQATPGPIAVNAATYVGYLSGGVLGALTATLGVAIPSFFLVAITVKFLNKYKDSELVNGAFLGIRPAAMGMITSALIFVGKSTILADTAINFGAIAFAMITFLLAAKTKLGPIWIIIIMGIAGALLL